MQEREFRTRVKGLLDLYWFKNEAWQTAFRGEGNSYRVPFKVECEKDKVIHQRYFTTLGGYPATIDFRYYTKEGKMSVVTTLVRSNKDYTVQVSINSRGEIEVYDKLGTPGRRAAAWTALESWQSVRFTRVPKEGAPAFRDGPRGTTSAKSKKQAMVAATIMLGLTSMSCINDR